MSEINLLQIAAIKKYRFPSVVGDLTIEDLYQLPLVQPTGLRYVKPNLDDVARAINTQLKAMGEESFVAQKNPATDDLVNKLEIVKLVIAYRQDQMAKATEQARRRQQRETIKQALAEAEARDINSKSVDELKQMLADLGE